MVQTRRFFWSNSDDGKDSDGKDTPQGANSDAQKLEKEGADRQTGARIARGRASAQEGAVVPVKPEGQLRKDFAGFEPWSIALPSFRRPLFPMQQTIIQVTSPKVIKELMQTFEKRPSGTQNIVSLFLHKKAPPGLDFAEEGEVKETNPCLRR
ncbi:unnamed protein product [Effrenium voratum]|nr:unnamed protein product [Effrenium voratum]